VHLRSRSIGDVSATWVPQDYWLSKRKIECTITRISTNPLPGGRSRLAASLSPLAAGGTWPALLAAGGGCASCRQPLTFDDDVHPHDLNYSSSCAMESPSSSSPLPLNVLLITGLSSCASAFTSPASPRVEVVSFRASLAVLAPFSRSRLSRTPLSALRRSSDAFQTQSTDDDLFFAQEIFGEQNNSENGSRSSSLNQNDFSYEMEDEYAYSQQMQDYSQQTDSQTQVHYSPSSSSPWQSNYASSSILEEETLSSAPSNNNEPISSVDARVLESILQEGKLDLSTEAEVKRLLEGPRLLEKEENGRGGENDDKYSSKFVSVSFIAFMSFIIYSYLRLILYHLGIHFGMYRL